MASQHYNWNNQVPMRNTPSLHIAMLRCHHFPYLLTQENCDMDYSPLIPQASVFLILCSFPTNFLFPLPKTPISARSLPFPLAKNYSEERSNNNHLQLTVNLIHYVSSSRHPRQKEGDINPHFFSIILWEGVFQYPSSCTMKKSPTLSFEPTQGFSCLSQPWGSARDNDK